jgi:integrase
MRIELTDLAIRALKPTGKQEVYLCSKTPNFGVRVSQKGTKSFFVLLDKPRRRVHLGKFPAKSLQDARKEAKRLSLTPEPQGSSQTISEAFETYLASYIKPSYRPRPAAEVERLIRKHAKPLWNHAINTLEAKHFTPILDALKPSEANHLYGVLRTFFNWCDRRDYGPNPLRKLPKPHKEKSRSRVLSEAELKKIWHACEDDSFGKIVRMLILTGQRRGEIAALQTEWISEKPHASHDGAADYTSYSITFPPHITKNGEEHTIPLSPLSIAIIQAATRSLSPPSQITEPQPQTVRTSSPNSTLLFPSERTGKVLIGFQKLKRELDKRSGVTGWCLHDLRRSFSTIHAEIGTPPYITEALLNHKTSEHLTPIARVYNRYRWLKEMREAMDNYDAHLRRVLCLEPLCDNPKPLEAP